MTLAELKAKATELGLNPDEVKQHGHIGHKATWERAIKQTESTLKREEALAEALPIDQEIEAIAELKKSAKLEPQVESNVYQEESDLSPEERGEVPYIEEKKATWGDLDSLKQNEEVVEEEPVTVAVNQIETTLCFGCNGTGKTELDYTCYVCNGLGYETDGVSTNDCPRCECTGVIDNPSDICPVCDGKREIPTQLLKQIEELPFEPTHTLVNGEWVKIENIPVSNSVTLIQSSPILPFTFNPTKPCKPDNSGYLVWDEKLRNWVKEKPSESSTPYLDKLLAKMMGYVDKGVTLDALADMQKNPPDECTAAIYLGLLEESERMLREALVA